MIRVNKKLCIFLGLFIVLGTSTLLALQRLLPLINHTVYYCQSIMNSLSLPLPNYLGLIPFFIFFAFIMIAFIKLIILYTKVQLSKKQLLKNSQQNTELLTLLKKTYLQNKTFLIHSEKYFAFCLGFRNPKIYISTSLVNSLSHKEIEAVLYHERYHLKNKDTVTMLIASVGESLLPFFPLFSDFLRNFRIEKEINADNEAIKELGSPEPLISALRKFLSIPSVTIATASAIADYDTLEPRINSLLEKKETIKIYKLRHILISIFSLLAMSIITITPVQAMEFHNKGEDAMMICPQNNACLAMCKQLYRSDKKTYNKSINYTPTK
ncbi:MAG: M56 family metallopeptidase [Candidatus Levyibacteriota bacterium]